MTDKKGHNDGLETLLRYLKDQLSNRERYEFERELERDPFIAEAFEGLSEHDPLSIERDLKNLDVVGGKRKSKNRLLIPLSVAAGFALIVLAVFWIVNQKNEVTQQMAGNEKEQFEPLVADSIPPATDSLQTDTVSEEVLLAVVEKPEKQATETLAPDEKKHRVDEKKKARDKLQKTEENAVEIMETDAIIQPKVTAVSALSGGIKSMKVSPDAGEDTGTVEISGQDAVKTGTIAVTETSSAPVIVEEVKMNMRPGVNASPEPLGGNALFREYLSENVKYPTGAESTGRETVRLTFKITELGEPFGFEIIRSPGKAFSEEAIRVIKEGPKWSPEVKDGLPVEGEVSLRIVFRP
ncbi:MAG: energy transducer TonB [Prolixibacteraceae bacterium]|nr:energy transducer TonB [Prolixibacteraceae bacterium]